MRSLFSNDIIITQIKNLVLSTLNETQVNTVSVSLKIYSAVEKHVFLSINESEIDFSELDKIKRIECLSSSFGALALVHTNKSGVHLRVVYHEGIDSNSPEFSQLDLTFDGFYDEGYIEKSFSTGYLYDVLRLILVETYNELKKYSRINLTIDMYSELMKARDRHMPYHMANVSSWAVAIGEKFGLDKKDIFKIDIAALLHDVGKLLIDERIINKEGKLTDEEYRIIMKHPDFGFKLTKLLFDEIYELRDIPNIIRCHHERYDGNGYPRGLSKGQIPFSSRILAVADAIDSMFSYHSYKKRKTVEEVLKELEVNNGAQFDPLVVKMAKSVVLDESNRINIINKENRFIPNVMLKLMCSITDSIVFINGNLISYGEEQVLFSKDLLDNVKRNYSFDNNCKNELSFYYEKKYYKYIAELLCFGVDSITIRTKTEIPVDKYFIHPWEVSFLICIEDGTLIAKTEQIGANTIVCFVDDKFDHNISIGDTILIKMKLVIDNEALLLEELVHITDIILFAEKTLLVLNLSNISVRQRDLLIRFLFRKQALSRRLL